MKQKLGFLRCGKAFTEIYKRIQNGSNVKKKIEYSLSLHLQLKVYQNQKQRLKKIPSVDFDNFFTNWSIKDCSFSCAKFQGALFPITHLKLMLFQEVFKNTLNKVALPWTRYMDVHCSSYFLNKLYALFKISFLTVGITVFVA